MVAGTNQSTKQLYEFGPFRVDPEKELLLRDDEAVPLAPKAFQVLLVLIRHNKEVVTKDDLLKTVWPDTFVEEANLSRNVFLLRKALGENYQDHQYIVTVPGRGYRFVAPLTTSLLPPFPAPGKAARSEGHNLPASAPRLIGAANTAASPRRHRRRAYPTSRTS